MRKNICTKALILLISIQFLSVALHAQPDHINFDNYTLENGLSNNIIHNAFQDSRGYMWFATNHGVCRYDGYKFTSFRNNPTDSTSLSGLLARVIYEDKNGNIWVGTESGGLNLFNRNKENFEHILPEYSDSTVGTSVKTIAEDRNGSLWMGTNIGIKVYNHQTKIVQWFPFQENNLNSPSNTYVRVLQFDNHGKLWVGTNSGLDLFDPLTRKFTHIYYSEPGLKDEIWEIYNDPAGMLWVGTYNNGLFQVDPVSLQIRKIDLDNNNDRSKTVRSVIQDKAGLYWIGTRDGLYVYNPINKKSGWFGNIENERNSLVNNSILDVYSDAGQNIWICTRGGLSLMVPESQIFKHYKSLQNNNKYLNNSEVYAIWADKTNNDIWIGTDKGGVNILNTKTNKFSYLTHQEGNSNSLAGNCIKAFMDDGKNNVWIGTFQEGISVYNLNSKRFTSFKNNPADKTSLSDNSVWALLRDKKGNIWVGTNEGLDLYNPLTNSFVRLDVFDQNQPVLWINEDSEGDLWLGQGSRTSVFRPGIGLVATFVDQGRWFYEDSKGRHWMATMNNGLVLYDKLKGPVKYYDEDKGLPNNQVFHILEDNTGKLWLSTANGLALFDPESESFTNFNKKDGLQNNQFHYGAAFKSVKGELIFGGINGFNIFDPAKVLKNTYVPPVVLTDLKVFNKSVNAGNPELILEQSAVEAKEITLPYRYNIITFEFAALNFAKPERNRYKFKLVGFDKDWNESGTQRLATYTNLDPGVYTFCVIASNNDNVWNTKGLQIELEILPPFWRTWWFKVLIILLIIGVIYVLIVFTVNREKLKQQLVLERIKAKQLHELDNMKLRFFTNISHEIRTPLTLILGPLERMKNTDMPADVVKSQADIMYRNANVLLKLVNQLLDFRKLETGNLKLELKKGDLVIFVREIVNSFSSLASEKGIRLKFTTVNENLATYFDPDKVEKILNNLLSNAFKFTEKEGSVSVNLTIGIDESHENQDKYVDIVVKDTGTGISVQNRERIFQRFFQSPENKNQAGTGIGLALTKELVKLHKGEIFVDSKQGKGSRFTVRLPLIEEVGGKAETVQPTPEHMGIAPDAEKATEKDLLSGKILLIVEDNADVRKFVRTNFEPDYHVEEAVDGKEGLSLAQKLLPDIIISDVMMPVMDGNEFCKKIKKDERTSHIPVILVTALSSKEHVMEGLSSGADDYITKPFDISILRTKIDNLLSLRKSMREKFSGEMIIAPTNVMVSSPDEKFLRKAIEVVEKNIDDPDLDIEKFSEEMGVSRMQMYRKLSALTDMTVKEFIRDIRLKRAVQLLLQKKFNVSEVAYAVGFKDLSHFRKCFREKFGMSATEYLEKNLPK